MRLADERQWRPILKIDLDSPAIPHQLFIRLRFLFYRIPRVLSIAGPLFRLRRYVSKSGNWHVIIESDLLRLTPVETVATQAILLSDWRREAFNLIRVTSLRDAPPAWRDRWNVLYTAHGSSKMTINRRDFKMRERQMPEHLTGYDKLGPVDLRGYQRAALTVAEVHQIDTVNGPAVILVYKEIPGRIHWLNKPGVNIMADAYGDDEQSWVGERVAVEVHENVRVPGTKEKVDSVWVAEEQMWDEIFHQVGVSQARRAAANQGSRRASGSDDAKGIPHSDSEPLSHSAERGQKDGPTY